MKFKNTNNLFLSNTLIFILVRLTVYFDLENSYLLTSCRNKKIFIKLFKKAIQHSTRNPLYNKKTVLFTK